MALHYYIFNHSHYHVYPCKFRYECRQQRIYNIILYTFIQLPNCLVLDTFQNSYLLQEMKSQAVRDRISVCIVAFLGNYSLICESEEKKQNNVSEDILQYLQAKLLGLVKSGKFKRMESTIIWSKHVLYPKRAWTASTEFRLQGFSRT